MKEITEKIELLGIENSKKYVDDTVSYLAENFYSEIIYNDTETKRALLSINLTKLNTKNADEDIAYKLLKFIDFMNADLMLTPIEISCIMNSDSTYKQDVLKSLVNTAIPTPFYINFAHGNNVPYILLFIIDRSDFYRQLDELTLKLYELLGEGKFVIKKRPGCNNPIIEKI